MITALREREITEKELEKMGLTQEVDIEQFQDLTSTFACKQSDQKSSGDSKFPLIPIREGGNWICVI